MYRSDNLISQLTIKKLINKRNSTYLQKFPYCCPLQKSTNVQNLTNQLKIMHKYRLNALLLTNLYLNTNSSSVISDTEFPGNINYTNYILKLLFVINST